MRRREPAGRTVLPTSGAAPIQAGETAATEADAAPPVAERRLVSVLFADLVGFTTLAEGRDAEDRASS